ncbi:MAG TPA: bifunctional phosphoribosylaminoimidazolecarboxamide formyltransferase/IMP cyclohydrolase [Flavobacteriaceae bacterium]|nr:bifunctional phosphoribosylaminoimidazolecarboxamide formyltransferase/IMP cyclohydrolase [Flavobacteriaceae bacterium]
MNSLITAKSALISVFYKDGLAPIVKKLHDLGIVLYSTGGTEQFIKELDIPVIAIDSVTNFPEILGGRVKTLHPAIFGGILNRRSLATDQTEVQKYDIPSIDIVIVDLYPFEETVARNFSEEEIIEKIDIGGISLIRAAAKNYKDVLCISSRNQYHDFLTLLNTQNGASTLEQRKFHAALAFNQSSHYDTAIFNYLNEGISFKQSFTEFKTLRYGENPHQKGIFFGNLEAIFNQIHGKELSYNNLLDVDAAINLMNEFQNEMPTFAILKHNNACGLAQRKNLKSAYIDALAGDPISAFGGVLISNTAINQETAQEINSLFFEILIAPDFDDDALMVLKSKKNRILLVQKTSDLPQNQYRTILNGVLYQEKDLKTDAIDDLKTVTTINPSENEINDLLFAAKICKHTKSNAIVLAKNLQLLASGTGQTSRIDALNQAINKAKHFNFDLKNAVMSSDAFFPFPDCVAIAHQENINAVIQPGGSINDQLSIEYCDENKMSMVITGTRHFKH